ncbi:MAG: formyltetrahydrofolate deformylase [Ignavibacteriales bacterium]|nr:formyltetrahydrofolate deformylase [Ignavibacteriales bacterium]
MKDKNLTATLLLSCPDRRGIVSQIAQFIFERSGNIVDLDEHVDEDDHIFFLRVTWDMKTFTVPPDTLEEVFQPLAREYQAKWFIRLNQNKRKMAIFVSKHAHCLQEILWRHELGEFDAEIALIISNHPDLGFLAERYHIPFHVFPVSNENKAEQEIKELELIQRERIDTIILARYMQVLSPTIVKQYEHRILNIHHSFLPAFAGANPYKQAYERGVKIVGATCHYVTEVLDEGPIIEQDIIRISHKDSLDDLIRKGRDLERLVLARGIRLHLQDRILVDGRKTVVFD